MLSQRCYCWWALLWSVFELSRPGSVWHWSNFWSIFSETASATPWLPKPCHANPNKFSFVFSWCLNFLYPNYSSMVVLHSNSGLVIPLLHSHLCPPVYIVLSGPTVIMCAHQLISLIFIMSLQATLIFQISQLSPRFKLDASRKSLQGQESGVFCFHPASRELTALNEQQHVVQTVFSFSGLMPSFFP